MSSDAAGMPSTDGRAGRWQRSDRVARPAVAAAVFSSVLCGIDRSVDSRAVHRQATLLASPGGAVEVVPAPRLTGHDEGALRDACEGHDLLAIGAGAGAASMVEHARIPVLIVRRAPLGTDVRDTILVAVDDSTESRRAVEVAGRIAAAHDGTVTLVVAPAPDRALQRAVAASRRSLLHSTGAAPAVFGGEPLSRERAIPAAALAMHASLVVLGTGDSDGARRTTAQTAASVPSSVLVVPVPGPVRARRAVADGDRCPAVVRMRAAGRWAAARSRARPPTPSRPRVLIAGAGVAGLETLLALSVLAADRLDLTLVAPERQFVDRSMAVAQPFAPRPVRRLGLPDTAAELGARWRQGALARVEHDRRRVVTTDGHELRYDMLVVAVGARPVRPWRADEVLTYFGGRDAPAYRLLLHDLSAGRVSSLGFARPAGACWPLPLYDLAFMTAAHCRARGRREVELSLITPEEQPLGIFGSSASAAIRELLEQSRVSVHTNSYGLPGRPGWIDISPGDRRLRVDRVVTQPRLTGRRLRGIPVGSDGFLHTDAHGLVADMDAVFAAGDATAFPVKHGALAAQQADAVAAAIAASVGADVDPQPFRPTMRGLLLTGGMPRYLQADISGAAGDDSTISEQALWSPPSKLAGRYLAAYLSRRLGSPADVTTGADPATALHSTLDAAPHDAAERAAPGCDER